MNTNNEIWKDVKGYEGMYQVSNLGRIKSLNRITINGRGVKERILKQYYDKNGYMYVILSNVKHKHFKIHRLVCYAFCDNVNNKKIVNHLDGNKINNIYTNLEWCTVSENTKHSFDIELQKQKKGFYSPFGHSVNQYTLDDKFVAGFGSIRDAERQTGVNEKGIAKSCKNIQSSSGGFKWKYYKDDRQTI